MEKSLEILLEKVRENFKETDLTLSIDNDELSVYDHHSLIYACELTKTETTDQFFQQLNQDYDQLSHLKIKKESSITTNISNYVSQTQQVILQILSSK